jgi:hypothetical protein
LTVLLAPGDTTLKSAFRVCEEYIDTVAKDSVNPSEIRAALTITGEVVRDGRKKVKA